MKKIVLAETNGNPRLVSTTNVLGMVTNVYIWTNTFCKQRRKEQSWDAIKCDSTSSDLF